MLEEGLDSGSAAIHVGYESVAHFNRDYSSFFTRPPARDIKALKERMKK
jgi:transcriptional regulator GlxA family with amidase domain